MIETKDIINIVLGFYGISLTTYSVLISRKQRLNKIAFSHEIITSQDAKILFRATNIGEKSITLTEAGFCSRSGRMTSEKSIESIAVLQPGESYTTGYSLEEIGTAANTITAYFAKDSLGKEYFHKLKVPISKQLADTIISEKLHLLGYEWDKLGDAWKRAAEKMVKGYEEYSKQMQENEDRFERSIEEIERTHKKWERYLEETGHEHPEYIAHLEKITSEEYRQEIDRKLKKAIEEQDKFQNHLQDKNKIN